MKRQPEPTNTTEAMPMTAMMAGEEMPAVRQLRRELDEAHSSAHKSRHLALEALYPAVDSNLLRHAGVELERARLLAADVDPYDAAVVETVLDLIRVFASARPSGFSAGMILDIFDRLARFDILTPITAHPSEWGDVSSYGPSGGPRLWQSTRKPSVFWRQGDETWYDNDPTNETTPDRRS